MDIESWDPSDPFHDRRLASFGIARVHPQQDGKAVFDWYVTDLLRTKPTGPNRKTRRRNKTIEPNSEDYVERLPEA